MADDIIAQKYNPFVSGAWDYEALSDRLRAEIDAVPNANMDEIMTVYDSTRQWWEFG